MNISLLKDRREKLNKEKIKLISLINMCDGAIQDCDYWMEQLSKPERKESDNDKTGNDS